MALCYYCCVDVFSDQPHAEGCPAQLPAEENAMREWRLGYRDGQEEQSKKKKDKNKKDSWYDSNSVKEKRSCYYELGLKVGRATQVLADSETPIVEEIHEDRLGFHERNLGAKHRRFNLYDLFCDHMKKKPDNDNDDEE